MGTRGFRARSHAHGKRHGRLTVHLLIVALAALAVTFATQYPTTPSAAVTATQPPTFAFSGVGGGLRPELTYLRPGTSLRTLNSVAAITRPSDTVAVRANLGVAPTSSMSAGVAAATASSGMQGAGVTSLADIVDPRRPFVAYETQPGDTASTIAERFGISLGTLLDNNPTLGDGDLIQQGQVLIVPRADGILHKVASGESLSSIVSQYDNITVEAALNFRSNGITDAESLESGSFVLLPGATRKPPPPPPPPPPSSDSGGGETPVYVGQGPAASGGKFSNPLLAHSGVSDPFGVDRGAGRIHEGIDLMLFGYPHSPIFSACDGTVVRTEWLTYSYGYYVVVDCGEGFTTLYAHLSQIDAVEGQAVSQGTPLGYSGSTGYSTGEHLHFEIRYDGAPVNPAQYIQF